MRRREFIALLSSAAASWPSVARAQKIRIVGVLMNGAPGETLPQSN